MLRLISMFQSLATFVSSFWMTLAVATALWPHGSGSSNAVAAFMPSHEAIHISSSSKSSHGYFLSFLATPSLLTRQAFVHTQLLYSSEPDDNSLEIPLTSDNDKNGDPFIMDDEELLSTVTVSQLIDLCRQFDLPVDEHHGGGGSGSGSGDGTITTKGSLNEVGQKEILLKQLRNYAAEQTASMRRIREERVHRVEDGYASSSKERYELVRNNGDVYDPTALVNDDDELDEEDEDFVYFAAPDSWNMTAPEQKVSIKTASKETLDASKSLMTSNPKSLPVTAPPPPTEVNADGERVVTVYSTTDQNDMTGVAAAQPGYASQQVDLSTAERELSGSGGNQQQSQQPWDVERPTSRTTTAQLERATEKVTELVHSLLASTGLAAFSGMDDDEDIEGTNVYKDGSRRPGTASTQRAPISQTGFTPASVSTKVLEEVSPFLRAGRGSVLQDVCREYELQAIAHDGMFGDDMDKGGGHYRQVEKVRAFLEGFRRAEVRKLSRETVSLLLDKLVLEGVEGLDMTLATMTRTNDDTGEYAGELNDSLLDYLNDAIRSQEKKVRNQKQQVAVVAPSKPCKEDSIESLWKVETEDGSRIESIDPNDPKVQQALLKEYEESNEGGTTSKNEELHSSSAPEQLLLLLTLLRERIKTEAAFGPDEKGRNLRLLAYCLRMKSENEREQLILKDFGSALDRFDSFAELVSSSIEYGESTSHQLQPTNKRPLNVRELKSILRLTSLLREKQSQKAAGLKP